MIRQPSLRHISIAADSVGQVSGLQYARREPRREIRKSRVHRLLPRTWKVRGMIVKPRYVRADLMGSRRETRERYPPDLGRAQPKPCVALYIEATDVDALKRVRRV
jgi:hypothetical protein